MSAAVRAHGPAWARGALELGLLGVLGPGYAEIALMQAAMLFDAAPAYVSRTRGALTGRSHSEEGHLR